jgi:hypothetical protein
MKRKNSRKAIRITRDSSIEMASGFTDIEELFHFLKSLPHGKINEFLSHYKESHKHVDKKDRRLHKILKKAKDVDSLILMVRKSIVKSFKKDLKKANKLLRKDSSSDAYIKKLKLSTLPAKIKLFEATFHRNDFYRIKKVLHHALN